MLDGFAAFAKALIYAALLTAAGVQLSIASLRPSADAETFAIRIRQRASLLLVLLSLASTLLLFVRLGGEFDEPTLGAVFASGPGAALALQLSGAMMLLLPFGDDESTRSWRLSGALVMTASAAFNGHSAAMGPTAGFVAMVHVTAAAWWVGSLWQLHYACGCLPAQDIAARVVRFSTMAIRSLPAWWRRASC